MEMGELQALRDKIALLEKELQEMSRIVHDKREDYSHWIEQGAGMERAAILKQIERTREGLDDYPVNSHEHSVVIGLEELANEIMSLGNILPRLPPDRLAEENAQMKALLEKVEWRGSTANRENCPCCGWCGLGDPPRHNAGCELERLLGRETR